MKTHELKVLSKYFDDILSTLKTFEVRKNDRDFRLYDRLLLKEWDNENKVYTGRTCVREVVYILDGGQFGIEKDFVLLGITKVW